MADQLDGDGGAADANAVHDHRYLVASKTTGGVAIDGFLDAEAGDIVLGALHTAMRQSRQADDPRTSKQRRADAFVEVCRVGAQHHHEGPGRADRPQLSVIVDLEVLEARGSGDLTRTILTRTELGTVLPAATLDRIACDCGIARIITTGRSQPLDVGRTVRTHTPALWRALVARDGGCVANGCDRPPDWCEVHHKIPGHSAARPTSPTANCAAGSTTAPSTKAPTHHNGATPDDHARAAAQSDDCADRLADQPADEQRSGRERERAQRADRHHAQPDRGRVREGARPPRRIRRCDRGGRRRARRTVAHDLGRDHYPGDDIAMLQSSSVEGEDESFEALEDDPLWDTVPAVAAGRVHVIDRPGHPGIAGRLRLVDDLTDQLAR